MPSLRKSFGPSDAHNKSWSVESGKPSSSGALEKTAPQLKQIRVTSPMMNNVDSIPITTNYTSSHGFSGRSILSDEPTDENLDPQSSTTMSLSQRNPSGKLVIAKGSPGSPSMKEQAPKEEETLPWSSAVGRATLGKSGRVIERLMAENDRLRREIKAELLKREEIQKREEMSKPVADALRAERDNLLQMRTTDLSLLARRDRKIEEMKASLETERARRIEAETRAREASHRCEDAIAARQKEVGEAKEIAKHATGHAEVLEQSHRQLRGEYRQRVETLNKDLQTLTDNREEEHKKLQRLDVVVEQLRQEIERANKVNGYIHEAFETYKEESEKRLKKAQNEAQRRGKSATALQEEVQRVLGETKYLLGLQKNLMPSD